MKVMLAVAHPMLAFPDKDGNNYDKLNDPDENKAFAQNLLSSWYTRAKVFGHDAIKLRPAGRTTIAIIKNDFVQFISMYENESVGGVICAKQKLVFSYQKSPVEKGFALRFLLDYLLEEAGQICTDEEQYVPGKALWERAVAKAFLKGHFIYRTDEHGSLVRLNNPQEFKAAEHSIWGTEEHYKQNRVVISKTELEA